jgi:hypothetical protein
MNAARRMLTFATLVAVMVVSAAGISSAQGDPATGAQFARAHQVARAQVSGRSLTTGIIDESVFTSSSAQVRNRWLLRAKDAGTKLIRLNVPWRLVVGSRPLDATNPADPSYNMSSIDAEVQSATAQGLQVMLTTYLAPAWAEGANPPAGVLAGTWKPNAAAFGQFGQMLATRYSGHYNGLPQVRYFEAWNEPNLSNFLTPQWIGHTPYSPTHYRGMLNAFYAGVHQGQPGAKVIGGATAPFGDNSPDHPFYKGNPRLHPMVFLRRLFCLSDTLKPNCPGKPKLDILSHHPVNPRTPPTEPAQNPDDVEVADFHKVTTLLHAAERAGRVLPAGPVGSHPLWASEIWWLSNPPNPLGAALQIHARWIEQALYLLWRQGASAAINFEIRDNQYDQSLPAARQATTGLYLYNGTRKPAATAWRFPFVANRRSSSTLNLWGKAPVGGTLSIQRHTPQGWHTVETLQVKAGQVFTGSLPASGAVDLRAKIGSTTSLIWHQK